MNSEQTETILHELIRYADDMMNGMTPEKKLAWLKNTDAKQNLFEKKPECFLPIKQMDSMNFQPFFIICNRGGATDPDMIKTAMKLCKKLVNNKTVCQIELMKTMKMLINLYKEHTGKLNKTGSMAYLKGKSTRRLNSVIQGLQSRI